MPNTKVPTQVNTRNIQGDILSGLPKKTQTFIFFKINNGKRFVADLVKFVPLIKTVAQSLQDRDDIARHKRENKIGLLKLAGVNISLTNTGLHEMSVNVAGTALAKSNAFLNGAAADAITLGDPLLPPNAPANAGQPDWDSEFLGQVDGLILVAGDSHDTVQEKIEEIHKIFPANPNQSSITVVKTITGDVRPGAESGHEHFGFLDGISNPLIAGFDRTVPGPAPIDASNILTGFTNDKDWSRDGSFLVFRYLFQKVPEFNNFLRTNALKIHPITSESLDPTDGSELLGARLVGRWKSGAPVDLTPFVDNLALANDELRRNNFQFLDEFRDNNRCPWAAHIRRSNPRADTRLQPLDNRRIMRRGISFGPEVTQEEQTSGTTQQGRGLLFACYQASIEDAFQFIQKNWCNNRKFPFLPGDVPPGFTPGVDPIIGQSDPREMTGYDPLSANDPDQKALSMGMFVVPRGGAYLFVPSINLLRNFSQHLST